MISQNPAYPLLPSMEEVRHLTTAKRLSWAMVFLFVAMAIALAWSPWQQSIAGSGRVIAYAPLERQQTISSPVDGRVVQWHVVEGTKVNQGDLVVEISDFDPSVIERLEAEVAAARERADSLGDRIAGRP